MWTNWAGEQRCHPARFAAPPTTAAVAAEVADAAEHGRVVRAAGAGHSFTPAVLTDDTLLSLDALDGVHDVDRERGRVRVGAGIRLRALSDALWAEGLAVENLGDIDVQSLAGATQTGTHGTGATLRNLAASIEALELVTGDGAIVELDAATDPDAFRAARVAIGALGIVTAITLRAVPAFVLEGHDTGEPLERVLAELDERVASADHFEFWTFPHSDRALTRTNRRVDLPPRPRRPRHAWLEDELLVNHGLHLASRIGRRRPALIPRINRVLGVIGGMDSRRVDRSYRIFASPRAVRFTEMEYAIPREHAIDALRTVKAIAETPEFHVSFPIEVRFVAPDDAFLSPASGRDTCYIAVHTFERMEFREYFSAVERELRALDGRPHWGKRHTRTAEDLRPAYSDWDRFAAVRDRLDPRRTFTNDYVRQVLGP